MKATGNFLSYRDLPWGKVYYRQFYGRCIMTVSYTHLFPVLPRYPVTLKIWFADEEFPVSGKIFLQDHADHYLSVEDAVTVGEILLQKLSEAFSSL